MTQRKKRQERLCLILFKNENMGEQLMCKTLINCGKARAYYLRNLDFYMVYSVSTYITNVYDRAMFADAHFKAFHILYYCKD